MHASAGVGIAPGGALLSRHTMTSPKKAPARSPQGGGWGTPAVALLCITCFFAGRFISLPGGLPDAGIGVSLRQRWTDLFVRTGAAAVGLAAGHTDCMQRWLKVSLGQGGDALLPVAAPPATATSVPPFSLRLARPAPPPPPTAASPSLQPTVVDESVTSERRSALEANAAVDDLAAAAAAAIPPPEVLEAAARSLADDQEFETAEEALEATGFLRDRPPLEHGESGHSFYTVQASLQPAASLGSRTPAGCFSLPPVGPGRRRLVLMICQGLRRRLLRGRGHSSLASGRGSRAPPPCAVAACSRCSCCPSTRGPTSCPASCPRSSAST